MNEGLDVVIERMMRWCVVAGVWSLYGAGLWCLVTGAGVGVGAGCLVAAMCVEGGVWGLLRIARAGMTLSDEGPIR